MMIPIIGLIIGFIVVLSIDFPILSKQKRKVKVLVSYITLLSVGFIMSLLQIIHKAPPSPITYIEKIVKAIVY